MGKLVNLFLPLRAVPRTQAPSLLATLADCRENNVCLRCTNGTYTPHARPGAPLFVLHVFRTSSQGVDDPPARDPVELKAMAHHSARLPTGFPLSVRLDCVQYAWMETPQPPLPAKMCIICGAGLEATLVLVFWFRIVMSFVSIE